MEAQEELIQRSLYKEKLQLEQQFFEYEDEINLNYKDMEDFEYRIMDRRITSNTTTLKRIRSFEALVFGGNFNGIVGYGKGKAPTY